MKTGLDRVARRCQCAAICLLAGMPFPALATHGYVQTGTVSGFTGNPQPNMGPDDYTAGSIAITPDQATLFVMNGRCPQDNTGTASIIDANQDKQTGFVSLAPAHCNPRTVAVSPDGSKAYIGMSTTPPYAAIAVVNTRTGAQTGLVQNLPYNQSGASAIAFSPDGSKAYAAFPYAASIGVIDVASDSLSGWVNNFANNGGSQFGGATFSYNVKFDPNPAMHTAYITNWRSSLVSVIDTRNDSQTGYVQINAAGDNPQYAGVDFSPDGATAYLSDSNCSVVVVDVASNTQRGDKINLSPCMMPDGSGVTGTFALAVSPDGGTILAVTNNGNPDDYSQPSTVSVVDPTRRTQIGTVPGFTGIVGAYGKFWPPSPIVFSKKEGGTAYVVGAINSTVSIIQLVDIPASVSKVAPSSGPATGGTMVSIQGKNLSGTTRVDFGTVPGVNLQVKSDSDVVVTTPSHSLGVVDVTVWNPGNQGGKLVVPGAYRYVTAMCGGNGCATEAR